MMMDALRLAVVLPLDHIYILGFPHAVLGPPPVYPLDIIFDILPRLLLAWRLFARIGQRDPYIVTIKVCLY